MKLGNNRNTSHTALVRACVEYLTLLGIHAWQVPSGAVQTRQGRYVRMAPAGTPDVLAIIPPNGRLLGLEVKTGEGRSNRAQRAWHEAARRAGALVLVVRDVRELAGVLG